MSSLVAVGPVLLGLLVGLGLRRTSAGTPDHGRFLLELNFYVCLPALVLPAAAEASIDRSLLVFPAAAVVMVTVGYTVGRACAGWVARTGEDRAVVTTSFMVVNCAFAIPFVGAVHGAEGVVRVAAFDLVHALLVATLVLTVAARADPRSAPGAGMLGGRLLRTPMLHALLLGGAVNLAGLELPAVVLASIQPFATASLAVVALGTGLVVEPVRGWPRVGGLVLARLAVGLLVATAIILALGLDGTDRGVLLMLGATPLGFVVVTFAAAHRLGTRLSTNLLLVSVVVSLVAYTGLELVAS